MLLASQYYRPPFPDRARWREDLPAMRRAGLDAIELWATWAWVEPTPGAFVFDDFDELIELAGKNDLRVIVTAVAEMYPYWLHDELPGSEHVDHHDRRVRSETLSYSPVGLVPGGCTDHPGVRDLAGRYLETLAGRYAGVEHLHAWDCWNEIRWGVQSEGYLCFCDHTLAAYRTWLRAKYGDDLDALNAAWRRRHGSWEEVPAGRQPGRGWVETLAFQEFLAWRTAEQVRFRTERLRAGDPHHPIITHAVNLSPWQTATENPYEQAVARGNEFELATHVDGFGVSLFPAWFHTTAAETGVRIESMRSATGDKPFWICELQGGSAGKGFAATNPVPADLQQRWIWTSYGRGAQAIAFWCWRDEVFGRESSGFGLVGDDGHADERVAALTHATSVLHEHAATLDAYAPDVARVAVLYEPLNHQLEWAQSGREEGASPESVAGYLTALERLQVPYDVVAASHLGDLDRYRTIVVPWAMIVRPGVADALADWTEAGGTLVVETELDAFDEHGYHRYADERPFAARLGLTGGGRRLLPDAPLRIHDGDDVYDLPAATWMEAWTADDAEALGVADGVDGAVVVRRPVGAGEVVALGTHAGLAYRREASPGFERFLRSVVERAGGLPDLECDASDGEVVQWRIGDAGPRRLLFVTNAGPAVNATFTTRADAFGAATGAVDLLGGAAASVVAHDDGRRTLTFTLDAGGSHVLELT